MTQKGVVEGLLQRLGVAAEYEPGQDPYFHPGRSAAVAANGVGLGPPG